MTDNEIIKALECCIESILCPEDCPAHNECEFGKEFLKKQALDLINRQKAEIERLRKETSQTIESIRKLARDTIRDTKAEAIKEFAKRLKGIITKCPKNFISITAKDIDNLVEEMVGESE